VLLISGIITNVYHLHILRVKNVKVSTNLDWLIIQRNFFLSRHKIETYQVPLLNRINVKLCDPTQSCLLVYECYKSYYLSLIVGFLEFL